jgi:hypothetical protein
MRNALYVNTGTGRCLEAACLAGLPATDWTWSVRLEDLDNDGRLDLFVTNGMNRESHNADLTARKELAESPDEKVRIEKASPVLAEQHLAFRNLGDLRFEDVSAAWGLNQRGVGFGAAFGDLDGDGNLDIVYSNYEGGVTLLRNDSDSGHRIIVALRGPARTASAWAPPSGSRRIGRAGADAGARPRGPLEFGADPALRARVGHRVRRLTVSWPSGHEQTFADLAADRRFTVTEPSGPATPAPPPPAAAGQFCRREPRRGILARVPGDGGGRDDPAAAPADAPEPPRARARGRRPERRRQGRRVLGGTPSDPARILIPTLSGNFSVATPRARSAERALDDGPVLLFDADGDGRATSS